MSFALGFDGTNDFAKTSSLMTLTGDYSIQVVFNPTTTGDGIFLGNFSDNSNWLGVFSGGLSYRPPDAISSTIAIPTPGIEYTVNINRVGTSVTVELVGVGSVGMTSSSDSSFDLFGKFFDSSSFLFDGYIKSALLTSGSGTVWSFSPSPTNPTGTPIWIESNNGNDATGVNMPTDGSAWINLGGSISIPVIMNSYRQRRV